MRSNRRLLIGAPLAVALLVAAAVPAGIAGGAGDSQARTAASAQAAVSAQAAASTPAPRGVAYGGVAYGGVAPGNWPVVIILNKAATRVERALIGLDITCASGDGFGTSDGFRRLPISRTGRFNASYGPERVDAGGAPADIEGRMVGRREKGRVTMRGSWSLKITVYEADGSTVADTCESGLVRWTATQ